MSLNIKNERTHALVRELATLQGVSQTEAVEGAVRAKLYALLAEASAHARLERIMALSHETGELVRNSGGSLTSNEMYDESGLPR